MNQENKIRFGFFGSSDFSVAVLDELKKLGLVPDLIVTVPDKPKGRGLKTESGPVKKWAESNDIDLFAPTTLKDPEVRQTIIENGPFDIFLVASYGKIIPENIFTIPSKGTLNIHPSLLPKFRGPTPIESMILSGSNIGVTIIKIDNEVDHGPIVSQKELQVSEKIPYFKDLEKTLAVEGARLFFESLPAWLDKGLATPQDHQSATHTQKITSADRLINIDDDPTKNLRKIRAFSGSRNAYFLLKHKDKEIRLIVTRARVDDDKLILERVIPEGRKEMDYSDFMRGLSL